VSLLDRARALWSVPVARTLEAQREANLLFKVLRAQFAGVLTLAIAFALPGVSPPSAPFTSSVIMVVSEVPLLAAMARAHRGHVAQASYFAIFTALGSTIVSTLLFGGLRSSIVISLMFGPVVAAVLRGRVAAAVAGGIVAASCAVMGVLESFGIAPLMVPLDPTAGVAPSAVSALVCIGILVALLMAYTTEMQRMTEAAQTSMQRALDTERRLGDLVRESPDGIAVVDPGGVLRSVNAAVPRMTGRAEAELVGRDFLELVDAGDAAGRAQLRKLLTTAHDRPALVEFKAARTNAPPFAVEANLSPSRAAEGPAAVQVVLRDVSQRVEAEQRQRKLEQELLDARRMEGLGRLAGGLAHDLRNMLTPIMMNVSLLRQEPGLTGERREVLDEVHDAAERSSELLAQILAFARRQILQAEVLDVNREITALEPMLRRLVREDIALALDLAPGLGPVRADRSQLSQVLVNLVANARDAMPRGGSVAVESRSVERANPREPGQPPRRYCAISVTDTGEGMSAEVRQHVFEPFFSTKGADRGVGLGLATVHGIVTQSGGLIEVESTPGQGSCFRVLLPTVLDALSVPSTTPREVQVQPAAGTVLVVDDEALVRAAVVRTLRLAGYDVLEAANGDEASRAAANRPRVDLLLTDVVMPGLGGPELATRIRALHPAIRVLFVSGYADSGVVSGGQVSEGVELMTKPFQPGELLERVAAVLRRQRDD
jgi:two-component system cell cycle sensor histidine kinase/response regulator CckA